MKRHEAAQLLGVGTDVGTDEIDAAFRTAISLHHPDIGGGTDSARRLIEARSVMLNGSSSPRSEPARSRTFTKRRRLRWH